MAYESIKVDIIPGAENAEVLHFSQYDNKRPFFIELFNGGAEFIPDEGMTLTLECRKRDGNIVIISDPVLSDNVAEFSTTEQLTACYGDNTAEIKIVDNNDLVIGSANFIINVEKSPTCGGLVSESEIDNLTQQIEDIAQEVIGEDYYNKSEVDSLLAEKADIEDLPDMSNYYRKSETYSKEQVYNKEETYSRVQMTENYYNKSESRAIFASQTWVLNQMQLEGTASGAIASFETAAPRQWLTALKCNMLASGGGGTPDNPNPIVGFTECNITNEDDEGNVIDEITIDLNGTRYGGYVDVNNGKLVVTYGYKNIDDFNSLTGYVSAGGLYIAECSGSYISNANAICSMLEQKNVNAGWSSATECFAIETNKIRVYTTSTTLADFKSRFADLQIAYELATPLEIDISPEHLDANVGQNNVFHDCNGTTEVKYKDTIQHYIDSRI